MFYYLGKKELNNILLGYFDGETYADTDVCILDTEDLVTESFSKSEFKKIREKLSIRPALLNPAWVRESRLLGGRLRLETEDVSKEITSNKLWFNGNILLCIDIKTTGVFKEYIITSKDETVLRSSLMTARSFGYRVYIVWAQKVNTLYRVILKLHGEVGLDSLYISYLFTDSGSIGVEYVFDIDFKRYLTVRQTLASTGETARLALANKNAKSYKWKS